MLRRLCLAINISLLHPTDQLHDVRHKLKYILAG